MARKLVKNEQLKIDSKNSCRVATTGNIASLTSGAPDPVDGISLAVGDRILVKDQTALDENGIYLVDTVGTGANGAWSRALDFDASAFVARGTRTTVSEGTVNERTGWIMTAPDPVIDTDDVVWELFISAVVATQNVYNEVPSGTVNGTNTVFTTANDFVAGTIRVYLNGLRMKSGAGNDYTETDVDEITFADAPKAAPGNPDQILVDYVVA